MKRVLIALGAIAIGFGAIAAANNDGKTIFTTSKCNTCHKVSKAGITSTNASAQDISGVGASHNAAWFEKYLNKVETLNGKKHVKKFSGTPADLTTLAKWLESLKTK